MNKHLYLHVPFCHTICAYCDFTHRVYDSKIVDKWLDRLAEEFKECEDEEYETIYIGGGTPSSLSLVQMRRLLDLVKPHSLKVKEYTVEVNPENIDEDKIILLKEYGVNRISMGLQSTCEEELKLMNRNHSFEDFKKIIGLLRKYSLNNISSDIIYSLPNQTMASLNKTLDDVLSLDLPHLSIYSLTIEPNSVFGKKSLNHLDDELEADMYENIVKRLNDAGYIQYEIANFAKPGFESKHNLGYWRFDDYRGLSCGSTSKINHCLYDKTKNINEYISGGKLIESKDDLSLKDECFEQVMMSLRTIYGLDLKLFKERYHQDALVLYKKAIEKNKDSFMIKDGYLICTKRNILNTILLDFLD